MPVTHRFGQVTRVTRLGEVLRELGRVFLRPAGIQVLQRSGDLLVQRGTIHNWLNNGSQPCIIAFALIDAKPVQIGGQTLHATG